MNHGTRFAAITRGACIVIPAGLLIIGAGAAPLAAKTAPAAIQQGDVVVMQRPYGPAAGFPTNPDAAFLREYDGGIHEVLSKAVHDRDSSIAPSALIISSTVVTLAGRKIVKSRAQVPSKLFMYQYVGPVGATLMMVVCTSRTGKAFDTAGTECERTAQKVFGA